MTDADPPSGPSANALKGATQAQQPKRFYTSVAIAPAEGGFAITLDGRPVKTPAKAALAVPTERLAFALASEWQQQSTLIEPATMPLTRLANSALDGVAGNASAVVADIVNYAGHDLLCYRAEHPAELAALEAAAWDPVLAWLERDLAARLVTTHGIGHCPQSADALAAIAKSLDGASPFALAGLHQLTTLSGSAVLALAVCRAAWGVETAWAAAHVDEDFQIRQWGEDEEAKARRHARFMDFDAAARLLALLG